MNMEVLFLGTGASIPSRHRSPACVVVRSGRDMVMLDCGEGSQRQMMLSPWSFMRIKAILITHLHGDHVFGLPGLLQTMGLSGRTDPLILRGPAGFTHAVETMMDLFQGVRSYDLDIADVGDGETFAVGELGAECFATVHGVPSVGYALRAADRPGRFDPDAAAALGLEPVDFRRLQQGERVRGIDPAEVIGEPRPGMKVVYTGDTRPCGSLEEAARGADLLIHEATYSDAEAGLAEKYGHATAGQAAAAAAAAGCGHLALIHVSSRYDDGREAFLAEAQAVFPRTVMPDDLQLYRLGRDGFRPV
jgi:ribonuclease Z